MAFSTASLVGSEEKLGTDPWIGQPACCGLGREPFFSGAVTLSNSIDDTQKVATYGDRPQEAYVGRTWRVGRVFPCRVYIDSNRHDSRI
jgi:hypothetical protein